MSNDTNILADAFEGIDYDYRELAQSLMLYGSMIALGVVLGAVFTALALASAAEPLVLPGAGVDLNLFLADLVAARDRVILGGLGGFVALSVGAAALEAEWI